MLHNKLFLGSYRNNENTEHVEITHHLVEMLNKYIRAYQDLLWKCLFDPIIKAQQINGILLLTWLEARSDFTVLRNYGFIMVFQMKLFGLKVSTNITYYVMTNITWDICLFKEKLELACKQ